MTAMYVKFVEDNEWEGETWNFYIPTEGNEAALAALADAIGTIDPDGDDSHDSYWLYLDPPMPETEVDVLVKHSDVGYLHYHNKLAGRLVLTGEDLAKIGSEDGDDPLYKGGIRDFMHEQKV